MHDYISRITTTSDMIWLDDRFRKRPLLSFKHYRRFDRTLRALTANLSDGMSLSCLTEGALIGTSSLVIIINVTEKWFRHLI